MRPQTVGRVLGVGLRVAGKIAGQRLAASSTNSPSTSASTARAATGAGPTIPRINTRQAGKATVHVARGLGGFVRPFRRIGGILFLEVSGVFFLLFVLVFGQMAWRMRANYAHGPDHMKFLVAAAIGLIFLYLTVSSFWRARRK